MDLLKRLFPGLFPSRWPAEAPDPKPTSKRTQDEIEVENRSFIARQPFSTEDTPPAFDWQELENGNFFCAWPLMNATVFRQDGGWKYVVNVDGSSKGDAVFSRRFRSADQAIVMAEEFMENTLGASNSTRSDS